MARSYVLAGMQFGDEGKGTFVDYISATQKIAQVVRYNGGSQASHTVISPLGVLHKFSQLGSAMFFDDCRSFLSSNMVVNPFNLIEEVTQFAKKTNQSPQDVLRRIVIDENCYIVTPYHKLVNQLREIREGDNRRGSVGTGVSEVRQILREINIGLKISDVFNSKVLFETLASLCDYATSFYEANKQTIAQNTHDNVRENLERGTHFLLNSDSVAKIYEGFQSLFDAHRFNISQNICTSLHAQDGIVFEGAQAVLIDEFHGFRPNTTVLDTSIHNALTLCNELDVNDVIKIGVAKALTSRHGMGALPTESGELNGRIVDANQEVSFWNGAPRFGWFDAILMRYAQSVNNVDEIYLSWLDKLDSFDKIKICNNYRYADEITEEFNEAFDYEMSNGQAVISDIRKNTTNISRYLSQCVPIYNVMDGWECDTTQTRRASDLPRNCHRYIEEIERLTKLTVSTVSVGPTRNEKLVMAWTL